jgi:hypothetical protein
VFVPDGWTSWRGKRSLLFEKGMDMTQAKNWAKDPASGELYLSPLQRQVEGDIIIIIIYVFTFYITTLSAQSK